LRSGLRLKYASFPPYNTLRQEETSAKCSKNNHTKSAG
jgi:hypothetical protein